MADEKVVEIVRFSESKAKNDERQGLLASPEHVLLVDNPNDLAAQVQLLKQQMAQVLEAKKQKMGNPAVVGLSGFAVTTFLLQFHNIQLTPGLSAVVCTGFMVGGLAQMIAGLQEFQTGNNFGYCAFTTYGAFWMALAGLLALKVTSGIDLVTTEDVGYFLVAFTIYTFIMTVASFCLNTALFITMVLLLAGFIFLDISHLAHINVMNNVAGYDLMLCSMGAWYLMAHEIYKDTFKRDVLPVGPAPLSLFLRPRMENKIV